MKKIVPLYEEFLTQDLNEAAAFSRVKTYFKKESPNTKIAIKRRADRFQKAQFGGIAYEVKVGIYKFEFVAYDGSTATENQLLRSIGSILDNGKKTETNPDFK